MMSKVFSFTLFLVFAGVGLLFWGCRGGGRAECRSIEIPSQVVCASHPLDSLFEVDHYVVLEDTEEAHVSQIVRLFVTRDQIVLLDRSHRILCYTPQGKFLSKLDKRGHAGGEYLSLADFDMRGDTLYLLDEAGKNILVCLSDGTHLRSISVEAARGLKLLRGGIALNHEFGLADGTSSPYCYEFIHNDIRTRDVAHAPHLTGRSFTFSGADNGFCASQLGLFYFVPYQSCLYAVDETSGALRPWATLDFCPEERTLSADATPEEVGRMLASSAPSNIFSVYCLQGLLVFSYYGPGEERRYVFHDLERGTLHNATLGFDRHGIPPMMVRYETPSGAPDMLLCAVPSSFIKAKAQRPDARERYPLLGQISSELTGQDTPVLIFYRPKAR